MFVALRLDEQLANSQKTSWPTNHAAEQSADSPDAFTSDASGNQ